MPEYTPSATVLVQRALATDEAIRNLQQDPSGTLKALELEVLRGLPPPDRQVAAALWLVIVCSFAAVLLLTAWVLANGVNQKLETGAVYAVKGETLLTMFTTVVGFLAGLLAPSPIGTKSDR